MKAMEILFDRIDELNAEIKLESDMCQKFIKALEVEQIIKAMKELENLRVGAYSKHSGVYYIPGCGDNEYI